MQITVQDRQTYKITQREFTDEGFLRVPGKVARTGIQQYLASELGLDGDANRIVNVYRPEEEVFHADSLASYAATDVTLTHPDELVNSKNYNRTSKGVVTGPGERTSDNFVQCNLLIKSQDAVDAVMNGTAELSAGYTAVYDNTPGITPDGTPYEFKQTKIRINHVAIVDRARAGTEARIFDSNKPTGGNSMPANITLDSGRVIDVADAANATVVADAFDRLQKRVTDAEAADSVKQAQLDASSAKVDDLTAKLEKANSLTSDAAIKARVEEISQCQVRARKIAGDKFSCDSVNATEIMRAALSAKYEKRDFSDKSPEYISAAFDMAAEEDEDEEKKSKDSASQLAQLALDAQNKPAVTSDSLYAARKQKLANAWKGSK